MADPNRIEQLKRAVEQNPNDELGQFALGSALFDNKEYRDAGPCFQRVLAINSQNSKAYELLASVQKHTDHPELAVQTATNGYRVAQRRGDVMPMKAMESLLKELGAPVPVVAEKSAEKPASSGGTATCRRCGTVGSQLPRPPFKGPLGQTIFDSVCQSCWHEWVGQGTKVINELRLPMHDPQAQETYDKHMKEFLLID
ncbi:MAG TPA: Fe(2+)-trafficking protein [Phycisphaerae bacterium]|nr:Fe(2+)-trafficking protein [Phycisphaerae bacterium]